jgi:hypothetical protein
MQWWLDPTRVDRRWPATGREAPQGFEVHYLTADANGVESYNVSQPITGTVPRCCACCVRTPQFIAHRWDSDRVADALAVLYQDSINQH